MFESRNLFPKIRTSGTDWA